MAEHIEVYFPAEDVYCELQKTIVNHLTGKTSYEILLPQGYTRTVSSEEITWD